MPANLSPEYRAAEAGFRATREPRERPHWLREMVRTIPKHEGAEHRLAGGDVVELHARTDETRGR